MVADLGSGIKASVILLLNSSAISNPSASDDEFLTSRRVRLCGETKPSPATPSCSLRFRRSKQVMAETESALVDGFLNAGDAEIFGDHASKIKTASYTIDGVVTDLVVCHYVNQVLIIISQFQKIGSLVSVTKGTVRNLEGSEGVYDVKTLCGLDSQEYQLVARYLANQIESAKPILFGISLKNFEPKILKALSIVLKENI